jgi:hypothetical protein
MEAGGLVEAAARGNSEYQITGGLAFCEVHVGSAGNEALELRKTGCQCGGFDIRFGTNVRTGTLDIETINPTCIQ